MLKSLACELSDSFDVMAERKLHRPDHIKLVAIRLLEKLKHFIPFVDCCIVNRVPIVSIDIDFKVFLAFLGVLDVHRHNEV